MLVNTKLDRVMKLWEALTIIGTWPFDHVTNVRSSGNLKNVYRHFLNTYGH